MVNIEVIQPLTCLEDLFGNNLDVCCHTLRTTTRLMMGGRREEEEERGGGEGSVYPL